MCIRDRDYLFTPTDKAQAIHNKAKLYEMGGTRKGLVNKWNQYKYITPKHSLQFPCVMNIFASDILFYVFVALAVILSLMVVFMRNPVSSAMMMALSCGATAAVMIGLGAHFLGILQILVYAGAIMVLFAVIIMPVSYTHLDVYKRQHPGFRLRSGNPRAPRRGRLHLR